MKGLVTEACDPVSDLAKGIKAHAEKELESVKKQADKAIQEFINENMQLAGNVKACTNSYWAKRYEFKLSPTTKAEIEQKVRWASGDLVEKAITEGIEAFKPQLAAMIEKALGATMQKQVEQMVRQKIEAVLKS
jgi:F0F1-type ATP synthase membrane subunit b/b'